MGNTGPGAPTRTGRMAWPVKQRLPFSPSPPKVQQRRAFFPRACRFFCWAHRLPHHRTLSSLRPACMGYGSGSSTAVATKAKVVEVPAGTVRSADEPLVGCVAPPSSAGRCIFLWSCVCDRTQEWVSSPLPVRSRKGPAAVVSRMRAMPYYPRSGMELVCSFPSIALCPRCAVGRGLPASSPLLSLLPHPPPPPPEARVVVVKQTPAALCSLLTSRHRGQHCIFRAGRRVWTLWGPCNPSPAPRSCAEPLPIPLTPFLPHHCSG
jgi:hypothetical protein